MAVAEARVHTTHLDRNFNPTAVSDLAQALCEKGSYPEALGLYQKVLEFRQRQFGLDHLEPAKTKVNIGLVYDSMGEYEKALNTYNEALPVLESTLGCDHLLTAKTKMNIGSVLYQQGKLPEAMQMYKQAVKVQKQQLGEHPDTASSMMGVALVLKQMGKLDEALAKYNEVLRIQQKVLGCEHTLVAGTPNKCAQLFCFFCGLSEMVLAAALLQSTMPKANTMMRSQHGKKQAQSSRKSMALTTQLRLTLRFAH